MARTQEFQFEKWRHGGWYVLNVRYPSGAVGCVSRNYPDGKWRIVCDERKGEHTYPNRNAAARAERALAAERASLMPWYVQGFEGFDPPPLPKGWTDTSWRNDASPSYSPGLEIIVHMDHPEVAEREIADDSPRFSVLDCNECTDEIAHTDDWDEAVRIATEQHAWRGDAARLGKAFADRLKDEIGEDKFEKVRERNRIYGADVCASHDFCDANMTMAAAFKDVFEREPVTGADVEDEADLKLWNAAWGMAKRDWLTAPRAPRP